MRGVIWLVLIFTAAVVSANVLGPNDGLVSIYQGAWRVDLSLNLFLILLLASVLLLFWVMQAITALLALPNQARAWRELKRERAAQAALREAIAEVFAARYARAQRAADRALVLQSEVPHLAEDAAFTALAQLIAAQSLHHLQDRPGRDARAAYALASAQRGSHPLADGSLLLQAQWALDDRDAKRAQAVLEDMPPGVARRTQALRIRLALSRLLRRPMEALQTARLLAKHQGFSALAAQALLRSLAMEALDQSLDLDQLRRTWGLLDQPARKDPFVVARAARRARTLGEPGLGREWIQPLWDQVAKLDEEGRAQLALALADCAQDVGKDWLARVEGTWATQGHEPALAAAAAAVFEQRQLWGKARRPLEQTASAESLPAGVRRRALLSLAQMARHEGDEARASSLEQRAARLEG